MTPVFPRTILPSSSNFRLIANSGYIKSGGNVAEVWQETGSYWVFDGVWRRLRWSKAKIVSHFLFALQGSAGEFLMWDQNFTPTGTWGGSIVVDGDDQSGIALDIKGATPNTTIAFVGDRFQLDEYLYQLTVDAVTDGAGRCTLTFLPQLIRIPADETALVTTDPMCKMMLKDNNQGPEFAQRKLIVQDFSISCFMSVRG